jgi:hypothetical protein
MTLPLPALVDAFVDKINSEPRELLPCDEVPESLREASSVPDQMPDDHTEWRIVRSDNRERIQLLQDRIGQPFPPSFLDLVSRFSFPAFEHGPLLLFANHHQETFWDLSRKLFLDPTMSPALLSAGFIQIGNPYFYNYDPVCFDCNLGAREPRLVQLDHEAILCAGEIQIVREIAPSFIDLVRAAVE